MARYTLEHKEKTHERILAVTSKLFREKGYTATGVKKLMKAAKLTTGGFYVHFPSKDGLLIEALKYAFSQNRSQFLYGLQNQEGLPWLQEIVRRFISRTHRDCMGESCPTTTLILDVARSSNEVKKTFEAEIMKTIMELEKKMPKTEQLSSRDYAFAVIALGIGAISLARAVKSPTLSNQILKSARQFLIPPKTGVINQL